MTTQSAAALLADKTELRRLMAEQNELMGFIPDPTATAEKAQAMTAACLQAQGLSPEDNIASRGIIAARDE